MQLRIFLMLSFWLVWCPSATFAQSEVLTGMEAFINQHVQRYALSPTNLLRVSAYVELRGEPSTDGGVRLDFGTLGELNFYQRNCLLRTSSAGVHHIAPDEETSPHAEAMDEALDRIFEHIALLSNGEASAEKVAFVDAQLAAKTLDPFHKIYARYLLLHYGRYDSVRQQVVVKSQWLPQTAAVRQAQYEGTLNPLTLVLTPYELRGYYHRTHGEVYVQNADRKVTYATGEKARANVAPFKSFLQRMMTFLPQSEGLSPRSVVDGLTVSIRSRESNAGSGSEITLYHQCSYISMMLGLLRQRDLSFGDPEIVCYFVGKPYFERIYQQLTPSEKHDVDLYLQRHHSRSA